MSMLVCLFCSLLTEKQMSPERNSLQWFIKCLTWPNEDDKKDQIYMLYYICITNMYCVNASPKYERTFFFKIAFSLYTLFIECFVFFKLDVHLTFFF